MICKKSDQTEDPLNVDFARGLGGEGATQVCSTPSRRPDSIRDLQKSDQTEDPLNADFAREWGGEGATPVCDAPSRPRGGG